MTPHDPPDRDLADATDDDLLVSAYLDGEVGETERARVETELHLLARVEEFRQISDAVSTGFTPNAARRDAAIAAALVASAPVAHGPPTRELPVTRIDDLARRQRNLKIASIAAAVLVLVLIAVPVVGKLADGGGEENFAAGADAGDESSNDDISRDDIGAGRAIDSDGPPEEEALDAESATDTPPAPIELGVFAMRADAMDAVGRELGDVLDATEYDSAEPYSSLGERAGDVDTQLSESTLVAPCPGILSHQDIDSTALVWWARYQIGSDVHDFIVFERAEPSDQTDLHGFIEVTTGCRIIDTGMLG